jgi:hypothetical protein
MELGADRKAARLPLMAIPVEQFVTSPTRGANTIRGDLQPGVPEGAARPWRDPNGDTPRTGWPSSTPLLLAANGRFEATSAYIRTNASKR